MSSSSVFDAVAPKSRVQKVYEGDCLVRLKKMKANTVDACVCDPPYGISFMGKGWDYGVPSVEYWKEVLRVLKPGGHLIAFGGSRMYHRLFCAIEDAGFEIRDTLMWLYGSGMPMGNQDISKAVDKALGAKREKVRIPAKNVGNGKVLASGRDKSKGKVTPFIEKAMKVGYHETDGPVAVTPQAESVQGWGTNLKPAVEPICLARKPLSEKTVAKNVLKWGTGGMNIKACRVPDIGGTLGQFVNTFGPNKIYGKLNRMEGIWTPETLGRWPTNIITDGSQEVAAAFPMINDEGSAAQYFVRCPFDAEDKRFHFSGKANAEDRWGSKHPTAKPVSLMQWLTRLVTPPFGNVLDPFAGSGTTGAACVKEGFGYILMEREPEFVLDIERRLRVEAYSA